jgi:molybdate transport system substrate-binding protein
VLILQKEASMGRTVYQMLPLVFAALAGFLLGGCGGKGAGDEQAYRPRVVVYGPCGLEGPLMAVKQLFQEFHPEVRLDLMLDNANVLVRKVTELGERPDVFISPGEVELKELRDKGLIDESTVRDFGSLDMAIIAPSTRKAVNALQDLESPNVQRISMGDPKSTSVGYYGAQVLRKLGLWDRLQTKLLLREAPLEAVSLVESGTADAGLVYLTCPLQTNPQKVSQSAVRIVETIPRDVCPPIRLQLGVLRASKNQSGAKAFVELMTSRDAQRVMAGSGILPLEATKR